MRIVISGGGTGGHIYPALAIADKIKEIVPNAEVTFVGTKYGLENVIVKKQGYDLQYIDVAGFKRELSLANLTSLKKAFSSLLEVRKIINKIDPDIILGTGGYVCGPVVLAGFLQGRKTCIQEQNAVPGVTNKILGKVVNRVYLGNSYARKFFSSNKTLVTGNPIRDTIVKADRNSALEFFGLSKNKKTVLVSGGSRGAQSINNAMLYVDKKFAFSDSIQVIHVTGSYSYKSIKNSLSEKKLNSDNVKIIEYTDNMDLALAAADIAVFRAGAMGLSELAARGVPSILVPYPYATANHQEHNARTYEKRGAAIVIKDWDLSAEGLYKMLKDILNDDDKLFEMANAAKKMGKPNATDDIVQDVLSMIG